MKSKVLKKKENRERAAKIRAFRETVLARRKA